MIATAQVGLEQMRSANVALHIAEQFVSYKERVNEVVDQLRQFKNVADICPLPVVLSSRSGLNIYVNLAYLNFLRCSSADLLGVGWKRFIDPKYVDAVSAQWSNFVTDTSRWEWVQKVQFMRGDGTRVLGTAKVIRIPNDGFVTFIVPDTCHECLLKMQQ